MGNLTVKITKSKNISFMRLSLFYLIFIVQIFFTSPGMYVLQYPDVAKSQTMVNERLLSELTVFTVEGEKENNLKTVTLQCLSELEKIEVAYRDFKKRTGVVGDRLRESKFAETQIRNGSLGGVIEGVFKKYLDAYNPIGNKSLDAELINCLTNKGQTFDAIYYFFKGLPNGVVPGVLEHFKTVMLYETILALKKKESELPKFEIVSLDETDFIQKFKRNLILGEPLDVKIRPKSGEETIKVKINGTPVKLDSIKRSEYRLFYKPARVGDYALEILSGEKRLFTTFKVVPPMFRFINSASSVSGFVGEPIIVTLDSAYVPKGNGISFESNAAKIERKKWILEITPEKEGLFDVIMKKGGVEIDRSSFVSTLKPDELVTLMDISGEPADMKNANKLESKNPFWQVVDFDMSVTYPTGEFKKVRSSTRFLRNELRELEEKAPAGSVLVFDNIRLLGSEMGLTSKGRPIVKIKG